jgi:cell division septation protein DedD
MSYSQPSSQPRPEPTPEFVSARARRRRAQRRAHFPTDEAGRAELFTHLVRRAFPSYELFVFSFVAGAILGLGYLFNAQALLIFGILVAPLLTPWIGTTLSIVAGALRLFLQTITALLISSLIIFLGSLLAGFASRQFQPLTLNEAFIHSRLWWYDLVALTIGAILITVSFVRSEDRPYLPSALLAYELFLPLAAAGFSLGSGVGLGEIWPQGLLVFFTHLAWATFFGLITLFFLRFYPTSFGGFVFTGIVFIAVIATVVIYTNFGNWIMLTTGLASPTPQPVTIIESTSTPSAIPSNTPSPEQETPVIAAPVGTASRTPRASSTPATLPPTDTATSTVTAEPTPILAMIRASEGGGAFIREAPGGQALITLANGATVTIIPNDLQDVNGVIWVHVFTVIEDRRVEGWMLQSLLQTATPVADWQPSPTP